MNNDFHLRRQCHCEELRTGIPDHCANGSLFHGNVVWRFCSHILLDSMEEGTIRLRDGGGTILYSRYAIV
jgi:hypothetical protein